MHGDNPDFSVPELEAPREQDEVVEATSAEPTETTPVVEEEPIRRIELPEDAEDAVPVLLAALAAAQAEAAGYLETVQRVAAEFDNFRKRTVREREDIVDRASQRLIERLLPTLDSFDAALAYEPQTDGESKLLTGMRDTHRLLMEALAEDGFAPIEASGVPFDPAVHEAVMGPGGDGDGDMIVREMRRGYTLRGRVVRAALVAVEHA
jgi:molecular chaperone GrpE